MAGKMSLRRQRAGTSASSFFEVHADEIGSAVEAKILPFVREGEPLIDFKMAMRYFGRMVEHDLDVVVRADEAHLDERDLDIGPYLELEEAATEVKDQLVDIRSSLVGLFGREQANEILATDGPTAKVHQPVLLWRQGEHTVERLRDPDFKEPKKKCAGMRLDREAMADKLEPAVARLRHAYKVVALERRKIETTVDGKREAIDAFDANFRVAVRFGVVMCLAAGKPKLAAKLNTSELKPRRRSAAEDESSASAEDSVISPLGPPKGTAPAVSPSPPPDAAESATGQPQTP